MVERGPLCHARQSTLKKSTDKASYIMIGLTVVLVILTIVLVYMTNVLIHLIHMEQAPAK